MTLSPEQAPRISGTAQTAGEGGDARSASGLVNLSTTHTASSPLLGIDVEKARFVRMRRRCVAAADTHLKGGVGNLKPAMVTLTYARIDDWSPNHIRDAITRVRNWLGRRGVRLRYVWTAELQQRGAVHYHIVCWLPTGKDKLPFWDQQGWWPHGDSNSKWAENPIGYIVKYVTKGCAGQRLPCGARMHGSGGFSVEERKSMSYHAKPHWVRQLSYIGQKITRAKGGGIIQHFACGLARRIASPWVLVARGSRHLVIARRDAGIPTIRTALEAYQWPTPIPV